MKIAKQILGHESHSKRRARRLAQGLGAALLSLAALDAEAGTVTVPLPAGHGVAVSTIKGGANNYVSANIYNGGYATYAAIAAGRYNGKPVAGATVMRNRDALPGLNVYAAHIGANPAGHRTELFACTHQRCVVNIAR